MFTTACWGITSACQAIIPKRQRSERIRNPVPYRAAEKLHIDQNEKLVMFGVTHVRAIDGYSKKIVGFAVLPRKNNKLIYEHLYL